MKLSIVIPIYKTEQYLIKCINSIISESSNDYEIILVNDGSPDDCQKIINQYVNDYTNIKAIHKTNGGISSARNSGMEVASGEYITFVDSDDFVEENYVNNIIKYVQIRKVDLIIGGVFKNELLAAKTITYQFPEKYFQLDRVDAQEHMMANDVLGSSFMHFKIFKTNLIKKNRLKFKNVTPHEDTIFFLEYLNHCRDIQFIEYVGYNYQIHPTPSLTKKLPRFDTLLKISNYLKDIYPILFKNYVYLNKDYVKRIISEYGIDQRIIAWYDIYLNNRLNYSARMELMKEERLELRKWNKLYGYKARRQNHQRFFLLLTSLVPYFLIDLMARFFFKIIKK